jgi:hypothetical protein
VRPKGSKLNLESALAEAPYIFTLNYHFYASGLILVMLIQNWAVLDLANEAIVYAFIFNPLENIQSNGVECAPCL